MANIDKELNDIKNAVYGKEVRGSIHDGIKKINEEVENTTDRQDSVEAQFQSVLDETTGKDVISAPEINAAKVGADNTNHPNLKTRLDTEYNQLSSRLAQTEQEIVRVEDETKQVMSNLKSQKIDQVVFDITTQEIKFYANGNLIDTIDVTEASNAQLVQDYIDSLVNDGMIEGVTLSDNSVTFAKRTRIGELCTVQISSSGDIPNIDTSAMTITFPSTFWVVNGKTRHEITGGTTLDYSSIRAGSTQVLIYFDTAISSFKIISSATLNELPESCLFFGSLGFAPSGLRDITLPCRYKLNGYEPHDPVKELLLSDNIEGTKRTITFHASGRVHLVRYHDNNDALIREDEFSYNDPIITETRTHRNTTITLIHNTDTLETEVI